MRLNRRLVKVALAGAFVGSAFAPVTCNIPPGLVDAVVNTVVTNANANGLDLTTLSPSGLVSHSYSSTGDNTGSN